MVSVHFPFTKIQGLILGYFRHGLGYFGHGLGYFRHGLGYFSFPIKYENGTNKEVTETERLI